MSSFDKSWKSIKAGSHKKKSRKRTAKQAKLSKRDRNSKRRCIRKRAGNNQKMFTPQNVPLWIERWNSKGGYHYWKEHFPKWQQWCQSALGLDRSNVSDPKNERALIDRFSKPERYMKHRKMGLQELEAEGLGWNEFVIERMISENTPIVEVRDPLTDEILYSASVPRSRRAELLNNSNNSANNSQSQANVTASKQKQNDSTTDLTQNESDSEDPYSSSEDYPHESDATDSDVEVVSNRNNSNNQNRSKRSKSYMKGSINSVEDAIDDYSQATGRNIKHNANDEEVFDVENVMISALKKAKIQRTKEIKDAKKKDKDQFTEMIDTILSKGFETFGNGTLQSQMFAMSVSTSLEVCFFQWCHTKLDELMEHYNGDINLESFNNKVSELMKQPLNWELFLKQWMFWRIMSGDDTGMVLTKMECFQTEPNLPPPLIGENNQFMNDLNVNVDVVGASSLNSLDAADNQSNQNGKAEIED